MRALCHLAARYGGGLTHIREIAEQEEIPAKFLEGILLALKRSGFVKSRRGNEGGYALARPPHEIIVGEVFRALDGPLAPMSNSAELKALMDKNPRQRGFYAVLLQVSDAVSGILDQTSLAQILAGNVVDEGLMEMAGHQV